jgi:hypothetical protein
MVDGIQQICDGGWDPTDIWRWMGSNGYMAVDGIQVHKVEKVSQSKSNIVWIYNTVCTGYTFGAINSPELLFFASCLIIEEFLAGAPPMV